MGPFIIKVCGVTTREDAQSALDCGANALGFNFYPKSRRYIHPDAAADVMASLRGDFLKVVVFVKPGMAEIAACSDLLDVIQVHGEAAFVSRLPIWKAVNPGHIPEPDASVNAWLLDTFTPAFGGSGRTFDWTMASEFPYPVIVAGGLDSGNVAEAIRVAKPLGVDSCSRLECAPGRKDRIKVAAFVAKARAAFEGAVTV